VAKHTEEEKLRKGSDYGIIASVVKVGQAQYPWLKQGMLYNLINRRDGLIKQIMLDMGCYPMCRHTSALNYFFDCHNANSHLEWLDETFLHFLFKQEWARWTNGTENTNITPPPNTINLHPPIGRMGKTPSLAMNRTMGVVSSSIRTVLST
jgi:hypothetical protein